MGGDAAAGGGGAAGVVYALWDIENTQVPRFNSAFSPTDMRLQLEEAVAARTGLPLPLDLELITFFNVKAANGFEPSDADVRWMRAAGVVIQHMGDKSGAADLGLKQEVDKILRRHRQGLRVSAVVILSSDSDFADKLREVTLFGIPSGVVHGSTANRSLLASAKFTIPWGEVSTRRGGGHGPPPPAAGGVGPGPVVRRGPAGPSPSPGDVGTFAVAGSRARECTFWRTPGGCHAGDRCPYRHVGESGVRRPQPVRLNEHVDRAIAAAAVNGEGSSDRPARSRSIKSGPGAGGGALGLPPAADAAVAAPAPGPRIVRRPQRAVKPATGGAAPTLLPGQVEGSGAEGGDGDIVFVDGGIMLNGKFVPLEDVARATASPPPPPPPAGDDDVVIVSPAPAPAPAVGDTSAAAVRSYVPEVARLFDEAMQKVGVRGAVPPAPASAPGSAPSGSPSASAFPVPLVRQPGGRPAIAPPRTTSGSSAGGGSAGGGGGGGASPAPAPAPVRSGATVVVRPPAPAPALAPAAATAPAAAAPVPAAGGAGAGAVDAALEAERARWHQLALSLTNTMLQCSPHVRLTGQVRLDAWVAL
jgi:hypothetical protein